MIDPKYLRIGNLIQDKKDHTTTVIQVAHLSDGLINYWRSDVYQPIELTPEWLERLGFQGDVHEGFGLDVLELNYITTDECFQIEYQIAPINKWFLVELKYVHQLQNLYYALTSKELTIK